MKSGCQRLYRLACQLDLEGIVAKRADSPYQDNEWIPHWVKIKNPTYIVRRIGAGLFKRAG
jgi:ATP-dependent DNA ligase